MFNKLAPYKITFIYILLGLVWIFFSDALVEKYTSPSLYTELQNYKGGFFIFLTASLIFYLTRQLQAQYQKSRQELLKKENENENLLDKAPVGIIVHRRGRILFANKKIVEMLGASSPREVISKRILRFIEPQDRRRLKRMETLLRQQQNFPVQEIQLLTKDQKIIQVELTSILTQYRDQQAVQTALHDITDRKRVEEELRENERKLKEAQRFGKMGHWEYNIVLDQSKWSEEMYNIFEHSEDDPMEGFQQLLERVYPEDRQGYKEAVQKAIKKGEPYNIDFRIVKRNNQIGYVNDAARPFFNEQGQIYKLEGITQDITSRKEAELNLKRSETRLKEAQRIGKTGHWEMDINTRELSWSEEVYRIYNQSLEASCPDIDELSKAIHPEDHQLWQQSVDRLIEDGEPYNIVFRIKDKDNNICYLNEIAKAIKDEKGELVNIKGVIIDITERKKAEMRQAESEKRYRKLVETIPDGVALLDKEGNYHFINKAGAAFLKKSPDELKEKNVWQIHTPDIARYFLKVILHVLNRKVNWHQEAQLGKRWYIINAEVLPPYYEYEEDKVLAVVTDITEQKSALFKLENTRANLLNAQRLARLGSWNMDIEKNNIAWSEMTYKILGLKAKDTAPNLELMIGLVHPKDRMLVKQKFLELYKGTADTVEMEHRIITPSGQKRYLYQVGEAIYNKKGKVIQLAGTVQDITERVQSEKALKKAFAQLESYTDALNRSTLVAITDLKGRILHFNERFCEIANYSKEEILGANFSILNSGYHPKSYFEGMMDTLNKGEVWRGEIKNITKEGRVFWLDMVINPIRNEEDKIERFLSISYEITDRKLNEEKLARTNQELETFLYKASHDLKGPLTTMNGLINIARIENKTPQSKQLLAMLEERVNQLRKTLDELVEISNIRQSILQRQPIDFEAIFQDIRKRITNTYGLHSLKLETEIHPDADQYSMDPHLIELLFWHMLDNSVKYRRKESVEVNITVKPQGQLLKINFADNAQGISPMIREKVFDMYYRGNERSKGAGLGLYIVKTIVERLNGDIFFTSVVGQGTEFAITLPLIDSQQLAA